MYIWVHPCLYIHIYVCTILIHQDSVFLCSTKRIQYHFMKDHALKFVLDAPTISNLHSLERGYMGEYVKEYYRAYQGEYSELILWLT